MSLVTQSAGKGRGHGGGLDQRVPTDGGDRLVGAVDLEPVGHLTEELAH
ncbi:hypothetical protein [Streptomyces sp. NPDC047043]